MAQRKVLITGRNGFTGEYVAAELAQAGWDVWGTGASAASPDISQYLQADLTSRDELAAVIAQVKPDAVVHLAAVAFVAHGSADDFYNVNLMGTRVLLEVLVDAGLAASGVIIASSANIYGNAETVPIAETAAPSPVNDYAVSKLAMEHMARLFSDRLPIVIARPFNYTGKGQDPKFLVPKIVHHFRERLPQIELGNLDVARDFSDVRDVAKAYRTLLEALPVGQTFNICSGKATSLQTVLDLCVELSGHSIEIRVNPAFVRPQDVKILMGDPSRIDALTAEQKRHPLRDTLAWMLE